ncbi:histidine phosphatase family protein [Roseobacter sinensis]|uniref:Histidine phosphatase family protein n=1 Tax=Roseobacter sinensis TaxID=2931391 RepID=A0ABT3BD52_9RHOB|nr:histidine phosphatase family protein [Roseobacter sp. WL0113]MCV3271475.1 histidine phosphatase family protein [Roseobacter sp. WL0113]
MRRRHAVLGLLAVAACAPAGIPPGAKTTVILVRHADRAGEILNAQGKARAANLSEALVDYEIDAIYSPDILRNLQTAEPLSQARGLPVSVIAKERAGAQMSRAHPNGTVIWIGNKGNLRTIWEELGAPGAAPQEYGEIGIVTLGPTGPPEVARRVVLP